MNKMHGQWGGKQKAQTGLETEKRTGRGDREKSKMFVINFYKSLHILSSPFKHCQAHTSSYKIIQILKS